MILLSKNESILVLLADGMHDEVEEGNTCDSESKMQLNLLIRLRCSSAELLYVV